jgi:hypothetical protein
MEATLSQEKAAVKPRMPAKRRQWKRLQSLLHISCPGGLIRIQPNGKENFFVVSVIKRRTGRFMIRYNVASFKRGFSLSGPS